MSYLKEFQKQIKVRDFQKFLIIWEEYVANDSVDAEEFLQVLNIIKESDFAEAMGKYIELGIPLWELVEDETLSYEILKRIIDIQTSNTPELANLAEEVIQKKYQDDPMYTERMRLVGLRDKDNFQGCLSKYDLLAHMKPGHCVYHQGGWGTGEIMEVSPLREQITVEFEYVPGQKHLTFKNAFKNLIPLHANHFLARRFVDPDALEEEGRNDHIKLVKHLLRDLGPKSAAEIKDEICELVIPEKDWTRWWQTARTKLKKDTMVETPSSLKAPFRLRTKELTHEERLKDDIADANTIDDVILTSYNYVRDFPNMIKNEEVRRSLEEKIGGLLARPELTPAQELQVYIFMEQHLGKSVGENKTVGAFIKASENPIETINAIGIIAFKKRALIAIRQERDDWVSLFLSFLHLVPQSQLKDYLLTQLNTEETLPQIKEMLSHLIAQPTKAPELLVWYFHKVMDQPNSSIPYSNKEGQCKLFDAYLVLLHKIELNNQYKELSKKMYLFMTAKRFENVRKILEDTTLEYAKEFLLLASKCHSFTSHDMKILRSLAQVVHPSLSKKKKIQDRLIFDGRILWTTEASYRKTHERAKKIGTVEIVQNAKEVEAAREHGDLRENAEYKFACEKRRQLQGELKRLSEELNRARIITEPDINNEEVGIGNIVELVNNEGQSTSYTILGPWDADPDNAILSFQSQLAQSMAGKKVNESFEFRDQTFTIKSIESFIKKSQ